jgi:Flp pilus assembly protein TadG
VHLLALLKRAHRGQRGQAFFFVVAVMAVLGGLVAAAVDFGSYATDRRNLQNAADAVALAASLELPDSGDALAAANQWATKNGIDLADMTVTIIPQDLPDEPNPRVRIELAHDHSFTFARLIGITSTEVSAGAAAIKTSPAGGDGLAPLAVTEEALANATLGDEIVLKYDANNIDQGNTGPIRIDGPGSGNCGGNDKYCSALMYGSENAICAVGTDDTYCDGATTADTEPGNSVGATRTATNFRLDNTDAACDEFDETFQDDPTTAEFGVYRITPDCNSFIQSGLESRRILIVPIIDELCNGSCEVTIVDFALFFLERIGDDGCTGNDCEVVGRFVRVNQNVGLLAGTFDADSNNQFIRLVE